MGWPVVSPRSLGATAALYRLQTTSSLSRVASGFTTALTVTYHSYLLAYICLDICIKIYSVNSKQPSGRPLSPEPGNAYPQQWTSRLPATYWPWDSSRHVILLLPSSPCLQNERVGLMSLQVSCSFFFF